jgi:hypothetical protein
LKDEVLDQIPAVSCREHSVFQDLLRVLINREIDDDNLQQLAYTVR